MRKAAVSWSSGKDSYLALLKSKKNYKISALVVTATMNFQRVSMHGVRLELVKRQAESLGIPLYVVYIPFPCDNNTYERKMLELATTLISNEIDTLIFGDIFLEDIKKYREDLFYSTGLNLHFPLWGKDSKYLAVEFLEKAKAKIVCIDSSLLNASFAGREYNRKTLESLPKEVDWCGENGEFHTFVYYGEGFKEEIKHKLGESEKFDRFIYKDLLPL